VTTIKRHGLARVLSKLGVCSRTQAEALIRAGRVTVDGCVERDPERPTLAGEERIAIDGTHVEAVSRVYLVLNKPRGVIVSAADERNRETIYPLVASASARWLAPVGRLDKASEGLLLVTNDSAWAARVTDPHSAIAKTYHVQVSGIPDENTQQRMRDGVTDKDDVLAVRDVRVLRSGEKNAWLEIVLDEGRNRHIRRLLKALGHDVLRLVRVSIGPIELGSLAKGQWRELSDAELRAIEKHLHRS
jgi:23S rRNA pseudouridine2605 synthase